MSFSIEPERKKPFSSLEKDLFLNIIQKYEGILSCKQTNATSALKKKNTWEIVKEEFNKSSIVTQQASTKQLTKLWYNMKAKARESKTKENIRHLTGGGPSVDDMDPVDAKVIDIDKNILTNVEVDIDSDIIDGTVTVIGDDNHNAWNKIPDKTVTEDRTPKRNRQPFDNKISNKTDILKEKILEEELNFKKKIHEEQLKRETIEREYREKILQIELQIKYKELEILENKK